MKIKKYESQKPTILIKKSMVNVLLGFLKPLFKENDIEPRRSLHMDVQGVQKWWKVRFLFQQTFVSWSLGGGTRFIEGNMFTGSFIEPYAPIPSASGFRMGFGSLLTFS